MAGPSAPLITFAATGVGALAALYFASRSSDATDSSSRSSIGDLKTRPVAYKRTEVKPHLETNHVNRSESRWGRQALTHGSWAYQIDHPSEE
ncbi:hypothetical protein HKX48_009123 [Thoreauomyces humboldtii]|nr:hypothetical protein HKX48_009123 [Thoreauomyces humboldtii]